MVPSTMGIAVGCHLVYKIVIHIASQFLCSRPVSSRGEGKMASVADSKGLAKEADDSAQDFRFYDNRQNYLLFVNTCSE